MFYIQENDKPNVIEKILNRIVIEGNKIIIPIKQQGMSKKRQEKIAQKTMKILKRSSSKKIVISKQLGEYKDFVNILDQNNYINVTGKWLYKMLIPEIMDYITKKEKWKKEETHIYILVNDAKDFIIENIKQFAQIYKSITIITNHINKFKKIEEDIYEELGTYITIMNNKKKGLSKAKVIINIDFPKELINQYNIYEKAIIVNMVNNIKINKKRFEGKIIKGYDIKFENKNIENIDNEKFDTKVIYESNFYYEQPYKYVREKIKKDGVQIKNLYLQNGVY